jgi:ketosteroid isomerase-like protein
MTNESSPPPPENDSASSQRALVERYFSMVQSGDPEIGTLFSDDVCWIAPQSSPVGRTHEGKTAVLELMGIGVGLYDMSHPMQIEFDAVAAQGEHVFVEMTLAATTGSGEPYRNHYVFVFRIREGKIVEIHEHLDTQHAQRMLFDPVDQKSAIDEG